MGRSGFARLADTPPLARQGRDETSRHNSIRDETSRRQLIAQIECVLLRGAHTKRNGGGKLSGSV